MTIPCVSIHFAQLSRLLRCVFRRLGLKANFLSLISQLFIWSGFKAIFLSLISQFFRGGRSVMLGTFFMRTWHSLIFFLFVFPLLRTLLTLVTANLKKKLLEVYQINYIKHLSDFPRYKQGKGFHQTNYLLLVLCILSRYSSSSVDCVITHQA